MNSLDWDDFSGCSEQGYLNSYNPLNSYWAATTAQAPSTHHSFPSFYYDLPLSPSPTPSIRASLSPPEELPQPFTSQGDEAASGGVPECTWTFSEDIDRTVSMTGGGDQVKVEEDEEDIWTGHQDFSFDRHSESGESTPCSTPGGNSSADEWLPDRSPSTPKKKKRKMKSSTSRKLRNSLPSPPPTPAATAGAPTPIPSSSAQREVPCPKNEEHVFLAVPDTPLAKAEVASSNLLVLSFLSGPPTAHLTLAVPSNSPYPPSSLSLDTLCNHQFTFTTTSSRPQTFTLSYTSNGPALTPTSSSSLSPTTYSFHHFQPSTLRLPSTSTSSSNQIGSPTFWRHQICPSSRTHSKSDSTNFTWVGGPKVRPIRVLDHFAGCDAAGEVGGLAREVQKRFPIGVKRARAVERKRKKG